MPSPAQKRAVCIARLIAWAKSHNQTINKIELLLAHAREDNPFLSERTLKDYAQTALAFLERQKEEQKIGKSKEELVEQEIP